MVFKYDDSTETLLADIDSRIVNIYEEEVNSGRESGLLLSDPEAVKHAIRVRTEPLYQRKADLISSANLQVLLTKDEYAGYLNGTSISDSDT